MVRSFPSLRAPAFALWVALGLAVGGLSPAAVRAEGPSHSYVVVYDDSAGAVGTETEERADELGFEAERRYRHAVEGFAAELTPEQVRELRADEEIAAVTPDRPVWATTAALAKGDFAPAGVRRILAAQAGTVRRASAGAVAVLDTGIDLDHPDLTVARGPNCITPGAPPADDAGHGTHVAGTIAARNDGDGVVGVAPGTKVYAVKVLDGQGKGKLSTILCGIDWVTANAAALGIKVANMSLSGYGPPVRTCATTTDPEHRAICASTAAGVTYVVSAGNLSEAFDHPDKPRTPAAYPEVLTVTAVADGDGKPGAAGRTCREKETDDKVASFSNYAVTAAGAAHTVAAPGVCVFSTAPDGYATMTGTSMATPHVAGVVALCRGEAGTPGPCSGMTPAETVAYVRDLAETHNAAHPAYGFWGDAFRPLDATRHFGLLVRAPAAPGTQDPDPAQPVDKSRPPKARVHISRARLVRGKARTRLVVRGRAGRSAAGRRLLVVYRTAGRQRTAWTRVNRSGRFRKRIPLRGRLRRARSVTVLVSFLGTASLRPGRDRAKARSA
ncbi:MAG TPA: S8 family serine peptidase [Solirubrobacterales bacterium]|jgi:subtilisin family serine protease